jgi:uncharacterized protein (DUF1697 family)
MTSSAFVILFRGVGGATQLPVKQLRTVLAEGGFGQVSTYINSGNAVLSSELDEPGVAERVEAIVRKEMGFEKHVLVRSHADWQRAIAGNPFPDAVAEPTKLHLYALEREPDPDAVERLKAKATGTERFVIKERFLYLHTPDGMGKSAFAPKIEPTLKLAATARNWRTVLALDEMMRGIAPSN